LAKISLRIARKSSMLDFYTPEDTSAMFPLDLGMEMPNFRAATHAPELSPPHQIWMIYLSLGINMLARSHNH
jgi:hypothetical protein